MYNKELSYQEAKDIIINAKTTPFYQDEIKGMAQNADTLFDLIFCGLEYAMEHEDCITQDKQLQGGDIARLTNIAISLPYYLIEEKYDGISDFILAFTILCSNYFSIYKTDSKIKNAISTLSKVSQVQSTFSRLIVASHVLISRAEKLIDVSDSAEIGLSRQFISTMLGEHLDFTEK